MKSFVEATLIILLLLVGQSGSCLAADNPKQETMTPETASRQIQELDGKRVIVTLKNGNSASGWARWKSDEQFVIEHAEGIWKCSENEAISFAEVVSIKPRNRILGALKDTGKVVWFLGSLPAQMVAVFAGHPPCGW